MEMLQLNDLHKTFNPGTVNEKVALNGVSLHMEAGDFATIDGLAIVKHIARIHNARIKLESQVDVGTTITVTFPTAS